MFFWNYSDALFFVKSDLYRKFGVMGHIGSKYDIREYSTILPLIYNSIEEYDHQKSLIDIRERALKKLTENEKEALGVL